MKRPKPQRIKGQLVAPSEHVIQCRLMDYLAYALRPEFKVYAIANGGFRHPLVAMKLKAEGVRRGISDLVVIMDRGRSGWIEMKKPGGSLSREQKEFRALCAELGHLHGVASSVDEALEHLTRWDALKPAYRRGPNFFTTNHLETIKLKVSA